MVILSAEGVVRNASPKPACSRSRTGDESRVPVSKVPATTKTCTWLATQFLTEPTCSSNWPMDAAGCPVARALTDAVPAWTEKKPTRCLPIWRAAKARPPGDDSPTWLRQASDHEKYAFASDSIATSCLLKAPVRASRNAEQIEMLSLAGLSACASRPHIFQSLTC